MSGAFAPIIPLFLLLAVLWAGLALLRVFLAGRGGSHAFPYEREDALFTPAERSFLGVLEQAVEGQYRILGKVRLADVIRTRRGMPAGDRQRAFNRIQSKHLDFVGCDSADLSVRFAVELDDKSHAKASRRKRDEFVDRAMEAAGVPLFRFAVRRSYSVEEVRRRLFAPDESGDG